MVFGGLSREMREEDNKVDRGKRERNYKNTI